MNKTEYSNFIIDTFNNFKFTNIEDLKNKSISILYNYAIPGLDSYLIENNDFYKIRVFNQKTHPFDRVLPHSHRYHLFCKILNGAVTNTNFIKSNNQELADLYGVYMQEYIDIGKYNIEFKEDCFYKRISNRYLKNDVYILPSEDIHSIEFDKNSIVLVIEIPDTNIKDNKSLILFPKINDEYIFNLDVKSWMFKK